MYKFRLGLFAAALTLSSSIFAQSQPLSLAEQADSQVAKPRTGQSMQQVEEAYGQPVERLSAVGEPPITRWRYADFTVYFEHDKVIHAVVHHASS